MASNDNVCAPEVDVERLFEQSRARGVRASAEASAEAARDRSDTAALLSMLGETGPAWESYSRRAETGMGASAYAPGTPPNEAYAPDEDYSSDAIYTTDLDIFTPGARPATRLDRLEEFADVAEARLDHLEDSAGARDAAIAELRAQVAALALQAAARSAPAPTLVVARSAPAAEAQEHNT